MQEMLHRELARGVGVRQVLLVSHRQGSSMQGILHRELARGVGVRQVLLRMRWCALESDGGDAPVPGARSTPTVLLTCQNSCPEAVCETKACLGPAPYPHRKA